jgi:hypothetical protein
MTAVGHYATSGIVGLLIYKITGLGGLAGLVAFFWHLPMDILFNEFWEWAKKSGLVFELKIRLLGREISLALYWSQVWMALCLLPAIALLTAGTWLTGRDWKMALLFGLLGSGFDVLDWIAVQFGKRFMHYEPLWKMLSFWKTILIESAGALAFALMGGIIWLLRA